MRELENGVNARNTRNTRNATKGDGRDGLFRRGDRLEEGLEDSKGNGEVRKRGGRIFGEKRV